MENSGIITLFMIYLVYNGMIEIGGSLGQDS